MSGHINRPALVKPLSAEESLYLSVGLGLSLIQQTRNTRKNPEDVKSTASHLHATARELISTRRDIQEFVLWLKTSDDIEENGEGGELPEVETDRHIEVPTKPHQISSAGFSGTAGTDSEVHDSFSTGRSQSQGKGGTLLALMTAYDESNQPEVQRAIRHVATLLD
jgi:hypothetical protein